MWVRVALLWMLCGPVWAASMTELDYRDQDPGSPPYLTRILVTKDYLRIDNGKDGDDYLILDRAARRISNVLRDSREVMQIDAGRVSLARPAKWQVREEVKDLPQRGKRARQVSLYVNNVLCSQAITVQGVLPDAVAALREYLETLAATQARTYRSTPPGLRDPCELAQYVLEIGRDLKHGLALEQVSHNGRSRHLLDYRTVELKPELFRIPANFRRVNLDGSRPAAGAGEQGDKGLK